MICSVFSKDQYGHLHGEQQEQIMQLLRKYSNTFSEGDYNLGCAKNIQHRIDTGDHQSIRLRPKKVKSFQIGG